MTTKWTMMWLSMCWNDCTLLVPDEISTNVPLTGVTEYNIMHVRIKQMLTDIMQALFPREKLKMYPDDVKTTLNYHMRMQRLDPMNEAYTPSSIATPRPGFAIDHSQDGRVVLENIEIKHYRRAQ
jgi:hypothetical protein